MWKIQKMDALKSRWNSLSNQKRALLSKHKKKEFIWFGKITIKAKLLNSRNNYIKTRSTFRKPVDYEPREWQLNFFCPDWESKRRWGWFWEHEKNNFKINPYPTQVFNVLRSFSFCNGNTRWGGRGETSGRRICFRINKQKICSWSCVQILHELQTG